MDSFSLTIWHMDTNASGVENIARTLPGCIPGASAYFAPAALFVVLRLLLAIGHNGITRCGGVLRWLTCA